MSAVEAQPITDEALRQAIDESYHVDRDPGEPGGPFHLALVGCQARIAALEAKLARLTAPATFEEASAFRKDDLSIDSDCDEDAAMLAMTPLDKFLERRVEG